MTGLRAGQWAGARRKSAVEHATDLFSGESLDHAKVALPKSESPGNKLLQQEKMQRLYDARIFIEMLWYDAQHQFRTIEAYFFAAYCEERRRPFAQARIECPVP